jgi:hypothetical protein
LGIKPLNPRPKIDAEDANEAIVRRSHDDRQPFQKRQDRLSRPLKNNFLQTLSLAGTTPTRRPTGFQRQPNEPNKTASKTQNGAQCGRQQGRIA